MVHGQIALAVLAEHGNMLVVLVLLSIDATGLANRKFSDVLRGLLAVFIERLRGQPQIHEDAVACARVVRLSVVVALVRVGAETQECFQADVQTVFIFLMQLKTCQKVQTDEKESSGFVDENLRE